MLLFAAVGLGIVAISWLASRSTPSSRSRVDQQQRYEANQIAALRCDLANAVSEAHRWFEMELPKPAWDSIADAFAILEALKPRIERAEWESLQAQLLAAIPRALDAQPKATPRRPRRRLRRKSRSVYAG